MVDAEVEGISKSVPPLPKPSLEMPSLEDASRKNSGEKERGGDKSLPDTVTNEYPSGLRLVLIIGAVTLSIFLIALDQTIVGTAIPKITDEFHSISQVSWYAAAYFMCLGGFQTSWGKGYRYFPLKPTFITSICLFEIGSLVCGVASNSNTLIVGRAIAGLGGAGIASGGTTIVAFSAEAKKRPVLMGIIGVTYVTAAILGPILGGAFTDRVSWRWCFYINLPIGAVVIVAILASFHLPSAVKPMEADWQETILQMDPVGIALLMGSIISFILALQYGGISHPWDSSVVIGLLVGFVVLLLALGIWEVFQDEYAMLVPRLIRRRSLWATGIFQFFFAGSYFLLLYYLPIYFQSIKNASPIKSGVDNLPMVITAAFFVLAGGITVAKTGHAVPFMALGSAVSTVGIGLLYTLGVNTPSKNWIGYQVLLGASISFPFQNCMNVAQANTEARDLASVTSIVLLFQTLGGAFSVSVAQSVFANKLISTLPSKAPGIDPALVIATGATELQSTFPPDQLPGIILSYMAGIKDTFAVGIALAGSAFVLSLFCPWKKIHGKLSGEAVLG